ncbi:lymphotoxin-beta isoform 2-T2 [Trichechus inunguis]|uniref:Lymphotoxin-beta isoform X2 n=1 Tax=Trichechus manatus latirostris TaxID=127582 RepID=A0A2Y9QPK7_TRIMA|nr:lymphotoxin-beta isoform X2 [Trichechus manatus latirostris]
MEALGLEGRGGRPQGRGCLLLAVAGAIVLGSVVLSVPITVLTVLALVPQERGGLSSRSCPRRKRKQISARGSRLPTS